MYVFLFISSLIFYCHLSYAFFRLLNFSFSTIWAGNLITFIHKYLPLFIKYLVLLLSPPITILSGKYSDI